MGALIVVVVVTVLATALSNELRKGLERLSRILITRATSRLAPPERERLHEEWTAELDRFAEFSGLLFALECMRASRNLMARKPYAGPAIEDLAFALTGWFFFAPLLVVLFVLSVLLNGSHIMTWKTIRTGSASASILVFRTVDPEEATSRAQLMYSLYLRRSALDRLTVLFYMLKGSLSLFSDGTSKPGLIQVPANATIELKAQAFVAQLVRLFSKP